MGTGVILMNDTSGRNHHGCARVMRLLTEGLTDRGLEILHRSPAHGDWRDEPDFASALRKARLLVINGEGSLHHSRPAGERLLQAIPHARAAGVKVALVNALWQDNASHWAELAGQADLLAMRDSQSAQALSRALGRPVRHLPDLSLSSSETVAAPRRDRLIFGDHVRWSARRALALAARRCRADALMPTKTRADTLWQFGPGKWALSGLYHGCLPFGLPPLELARDEAAYLTALGRAQLHVTGRFHGVCLSLITATPFLAVASNSWKIESLLAEAGLSDRLLHLSALKALTPDDLFRPFTPTETAGLTRFLAIARRQAESLFDDLANLARSAG